MVQRPDEDTLIARYLAPLASDPAAFNLTDDAACLAVPPGHELVITTDALVAGVHFFADDPPALIARKALRTNLSDLAAKGARPRAYLLTLALPDAWDEAWLADFVTGLALDQKHFEVSLLGGDTTRAAGPLTLSITALGLVPVGKMVRRKGAQAGDRVFVTGTIGDAAFGCRMRLEPARFATMPADHRAHLLQRYLLPQPRHALAQVLQAHASAAMDVSDGLAGDCAKLCRASGVSATLDVARVPLSNAARALCGAGIDMLQLALSGGDDYEILFTVAPDRCSPLMADARAADVAVSEIGTIVAGSALPRFVHEGGVLSFTTTSFSHF